MSRRDKRAASILLLAISLFIPLSSSYSLYDDLSEAMFLSDKVNFESPSDEDASILENESRTLLPGVFFEILRQIAHSLKETCRIFSRLTSPGQNSAILRC